MTSTDPRNLETVAEHHLTAVHTIEEETKRLASCLGFSNDLDRLMLLPGTHKTSPHTASLRRHLAIVTDLLEQTGAALYGMHLARPLPDRSAAMLHFGISSVQEIVSDAHRAACCRVASEAINQLGAAANMMREISKAAMESPVLAEHRAAATATGAATGEAPHS